MTTATVTRLPEGYQKDLRERLEREGHSGASIEALLALDAEMFVWHRRMAKGELAGRLLADLDIDLEVAQFHALTAIGRIENGLGRERAAPATVGLLAGEMAIDPSRASRLATGLIEQGWLRREAAQEDGRKIVLVLTDKARAMFRAFRAAKWARLQQVFSDWSDADIATFSRLFVRYSEALGRNF